MRIHGYEMEVLMERFASRFGDNHEAIMTIKLEVNISMRTD